MTLEDHLAKTHLTLRRWIGYLAIGLPLILAGGGILQHLQLQNSISAYYHAFVANSLLPDVFSVAGNGLMRNWFVGILWVIGFFLLAYRGFDQREDLALTSAGMLLIIVAMAPMGWTCRDKCPWVSIHGVAAILFFLAIGYVCIFRASDTLPLLTQAEQNKLKKYYKAIGTVMWLFPITVLILETFKIHLFGPYTVFIVESVGIWTFASYWLLKGCEIGRSGADIMAFRGQLSPARRKAKILDYWFDTTPLTINRDGRSSEADP